MTMDLENRDGIGKGWDGENRNGMMDLDNGQGWRMGKSTRLAIWRSKDPRRELVHDIVTPIFFPILIAALTCVIVLMCKNCILGIYHEFRNFRKKRIVLHRKSINGRYNRDLECGYPNLIQLEKCVFHYNHWRYWWHYYSNNTDTLFSIYLDNVCKGNSGYVFSKTLSGIMRGIIKKARKSFLQVKNESRMVKSTYSLSRAKLHFFHSDDGYTIMYT